MPRAVPVPVRRQVLTLSQERIAAPVIAERLGLSPRTVRHLLSLPLEDLAQPYRSLAGPRPASAPLRGLAIAWRSEHPGWGAGFIRARLPGPPADRPSARTIQRWLDDAGLGPAPCGKRRAPRQRRSEQTHEVWQMDAADQIALADGRLVSWLRVTDECSGAVLGTAVFPRVFNGVPAEEVRCWLRRLWARWGLPDAFRVDNGAPWGGKSELPPDLSLWLIGLGVEMRWNPPRQPRYNGVVERSHGVSKPWVEPWTCSSREELQERLDEADTIQRERYELAGGLTRMQAFPCLAQERRPYDEAGEQAMWQEGPVLEHLAGLAARRKVGQDGRISLYNRAVGVGIRQAGQHVWVHLDAAERAWVVCDDSGRQLRVQPVPWLTADSIRALSVTKP